jgi:hypothetical protein
MLIKLPGYNSVPFLSLLKRVFQSIFKMTATFDLLKFTRPSAFMIESYSAFDDAFFRLPTLPEYCVDAIPCPVGTLYIRGSDISDGNTFACINPSFVKRADLLITLRSSLKLPSHA